jgi:16S rRNA (cytidine1402-2'-O)-methyltransferase
MSTLYIVGTPIGNLDDITLRAIAILSQVEVIYCEDTRVTAKLLKHLNLSKPLKQLHAHTRTISLNPDQNTAYVSDAGTPGISDPGAMLVRAARDLGMKIEPIPGPSAITALISVSGREVTEFTFLGFLPHKKGRLTKLKEIAVSEYPAILYESPHRIEKLLKELIEHVPDAHILIGRELTKKFEEVLEGTPSELSDLFKKNPEKVRGEFVLLIDNNI